MNGFQLGGRAIKVGWADTATPTQPSADSGGIVTLSAAQVAANPSMAPLSAYSQAAAEQEVRASSFVSVFLAVCVCVCTHHEIVLLQANVVHEMYDV
jgi:hypothetical protein